MIVRIAVENLVLVERAQFEPASGLTVITGETGAGKTLLTNAIRLLFGGDADSAQVGPWSDQTFVEGEFEVPESFWADPSVAALAELRPDTETPLVLARKIGREGRSRALAWGRTVTKSDLAAAGSLLLATAGQHSQRKLLSPAVQRTTLDGAGTASHQKLLSEFEQLWEVLQQRRQEEVRLQQEVEESLRDAEQRAADLELLNSVSPDAADETELLARRERARHHAELATGLAGGLSAIDGDSGGSGAVEALGVTWAQIDRVVEIDPSLRELADSLLNVQQLASECARALREHLDHLEAEDASSLDEIEERLGCYDDLKRRFGGTTESVLARWDQLRADDSMAESGEAALQVAQERTAQARAAVEACAQQLSVSRREVAQHLAGCVRDQLATLGMGGSEFLIAVEPAPLSRTGGDNVEYRLAPSSQIEPRPVVQVASGGELSRLALALHVVGGVADTPTIIFDEIDAGIGGHTAHAIGALLRQLGDITQVICVTHLPQVAARASSHVIVQRGDDRIELAHLDTDERVLDELCRMLGADATDESARHHAAAMRGPGIGVARRTSAEHSSTDMAQSSLPIP